MSRWMQAETIMKDGSWKAVVFQEDSRFRVPSSSGIYIIVGHPPSDSAAKRFLKLQTPLYIGYSENLRKRMRDHINGTTSVVRVSNMFHEMKFWWLGLPTADKNELLGSEQMLIDIFGPSANEINAIRASVGEGMPVGDLPQA